MPGATGLVPWYAPPRRVAGRVAGRVALGASGTLRQAAGHQASGGTLRQVASIPGPLLEPGHPASKSRLVATIRCMVLHRIGSACICASMHGPDALLTGARAPCTTHPAVVHAPSPRHMEPPLACLGGARPGHACSLAATGMEASGCRARLWFFSFFWCSLFLWVRACSRLWEAEPDRGSLSGKPVPQLWEACHNGP
jgi:hypothetical protein